MAARTATMSATTTCVRGRADAAGGAGDEDGFWGTIFFPY